MNSYAANSIQRASFKKKTCMIISCGNTSAETISGCSVASTRLLRKRVALVRGRIFIPASKLV